MSGEVVVAELMTAAGALLASVVCEMVDRWAVNGRRKVGGRMARSKQTRLSCRDSIVVMLFEWMVGLVLLLFTLVLDSRNSICPTFDFLRRCQDRNSRPPHHVFALFAPNTTSTSPQLVCCLCCCVVAITCRICYLHAVSCIREFGSA